MAPKTQIGVHGPSPFVEVMLAVSSMLLITFTLLCAKSKKHNLPKQKSIHNPKPPPSGNTSRRQSNTAAAVAAHTSYPESVLIVSPAATSPVLTPSTLVTSPSCQTGRESLGTVRVLSAGNMDSDAASVSVPGAMSYGAEYASVEDLATEMSPMSGRVSFPSSPRSSSSLNARRTSCPNTKVPPAKVRELRHLSSLQANSCPLPSSHTQSTYSELSSIPSPKSLSNVIVDDGDYAEVTVERKSLRSTSGGSPSRKSVCNYATVDFPNGSPNGSLKSKSPVTATVSLGARSPHTGTSSSSGKNQVYSQSRKVRLNTPSDVAIGDSNYAQPCKTRLGVSNSLPTRRKSTSALDFSTPQSPALSREELSGAECVYARPSFGDTGLDLADSYGMQETPTSSHPDVPIKTPGSFTLLLNPHESE